MHDHHRALHGADEVPASGVLVIEEAGSRAYLHAWQVSASAPPNKPPERRHWRDMGRAERVCMFLVLVIVVAGVPLLVYFLWRVGGAMLVGVFARGRTAL